jgi:hypothetical protein
MSLRVTVTDEQTGETETRRIAAGDYAIVTAHPCMVDTFSEVKDGKMTINLKNFAPQKLRDYEVILTER